MPEESLTTSHLSVAIATTEVTQITGDNSMTSSSTVSVAVYFRCAVVVIGLVGTAANALILYGLVASKQHKKHVLIFNQNALDLFASFFLIVTYAVKLCNIYLAGSHDYWLCRILLSDSLPWCGMMGSTINLASITIERYLKVVHPVWSKKKLHSWMIYSAVAFAWISSIIYNLASAIPTTAVIDGACYPYVIWQNETARVIHVIWYFISFYVIILLIIIVGYWRILVVIRRQARVMAGHSAAGSNTGQSQLSDMESSVIKTMILVSAFFAISQLPNRIFILIANVNSNFSLFNTTYFTSVFIAFLYICINPFIYAIKFDPVKHALLRLMPCKTNSDPAIEIINIT